MGCGWCGICPASSTVFLPQLLRIYRNLEAVDKIHTAGNIPHMASNEKKVPQSMGERIEERLEVMNLSARAASIAAGGGSDLIRNIQRGKSKSPTVEHVANLATVLGTTVEWLVSGRGEVAAPDIIPNFSSNKLKVPLLSWVSAGTMAFPDISDETITTIEETGLDPNGDWIALRVVGDSMDRVSPPDSIIFIDRSDKALVPNACYVISTPDGQATYKRFRPNPMRFEPVSTNPNHETLYPQREPLIVGRVKKTVLDM